jgi:hypothetical protein
MEEIMIFKYDPNKLSEYRKKGILATLPLFILGIFIVLPILYLINKDLEDILFIIFTTLILMIISGGIGIMIGYKKAKNEFDSYQIECNDKVMIIKSKMMNKELKISQITKIQKDNKNNIYIVLNKINKIKILSFIENYVELENYLTSIMTIEQYNRKNDIFQYLPAIFLIALMYISKFGNIQLYLIFAVIVILTTIYSMIKLFMDQIRMRYKIMTIIIDGIIICSVLYGIYKVIDYLKQ